MSYGRNDGKYEAEGKPIGADDGNELADNPVGLSAAGLEQIAPPRYIEVMAGLIAVLDAAHKKYYMKGKEPGIFEARSIWSDVMGRYDEVVKAGQAIAKRENGGGEADNDSGQG